MTAILVAVPIYLRRLGLMDSWLAPFRWVVLTVLAMGLHAGVARLRSILDRRHRV